MRIFRAQLLSVLAIENTNRRVEDLVLDLGEAEAATLEKEENGQPVCLIRNIQTTIGGTC
jgi:hypothetical protein